MVGFYQKIEDGVVEGYRKIEDIFVEVFLMPDDTVQEKVDTDANNQKEGAKIRMSENTVSGNKFVGYEYKSITIDCDMESMYADGYQNFGWMLESTSKPQVGVNTITMKFKRDRKIRNKAELTRLQRQFDASASEITRMEKSKNSHALKTALIVGSIGTAFLAGATFAYLGGLIVLCIVLALPGFIGWILPFFLYNSSYAKQVAKVDPLIEKKQDEIYELCERANDLLGN